MAQRISSPVLVGRDGEVARLRAALERAAAGQPATVVVAGEAGVGKTRLIGELLRQAGELGAVALTGGCLDVGDGVLAYAPLVEALRPLAGLLEPEELERLGRRELAELLTAILGEEAAPPLVSDILARSEGNPFFAEELLAAHLGGSRLPEALRDLLLARVEALSEAAQRVVEIAAVAGSRVDHELLAAVAGQDAEQMVWLLRQAIGHHVLAVELGQLAYHARNSCR